MAGTYGQAPAQLGIPENLYSQFNAAIPGGSANAASASSFIGSELGGQVAPDVQNLIQNKGAAYGVSSGQPMTGGPGSFSSNNYLANLGLTSQSLQQQGTKDYMSFLGSVTPTLTNPNLAYEVGLQNAVDAAAPDPGAAAQRMINLSRPSGGFSFAPTTAQDGRSLTTDASGNPIDGGDPFGLNQPSGAPVGAGGQPWSPDFGAAAPATPTIYSGYSGPASASGGPSSSYMGDPSGAPAYGAQGSGVDNMLSSYINSLGLGSYNTSGGGF